MRGGRSETESDSERSHGRHGKIGRENQEGFTRKERRARRRRKRGRRILTTNYTKDTKGGGIGEFAAKRRKNFSRATKKF